MRPCFGVATRQGQGTSDDIAADRSLGYQCRLVFLAAAGLGAGAGDFPNRSIRIVIPYSPSSVADVFARIVAQDVQEQWKGTIIIEAKSGANGSITAEEVARAAPDGCTWLLVTTFFCREPGA